MYLCSNLLGRIGMNKDLEEPLITFFRKTSVAVGASTTPQISAPEEVHEPKDQIFFWDGKKETLNILRHFLVARLKPMKHLKSGLTYTGQNLSELVDETLAWYWSEEAGPPVKAADHHFVNPRALRMEGKGRNDTIFSITSSGYEIPSSDEVPFLQDVMFCNRELSN
ncbi:hypothetical protein Mapa_003197 [Marchantia paleacea]|nr:hypothetical protein Mapa_003197 [Marchantia paleacea]